MILSSRSRLSCFSFLSVLSLLTLLLSSSSSLVRVVSDSHASLSLISVSTPMVSALNAPIWPTLVLPMSSMALMLVLPTLMMVLLVLDTDMMSSVLICNIFSRYCKICWKCWSLVDRIDSSLRVSSLYFYSYESSCVCSVLLMCCNYDTLSECCDLSSDSSCYTLAALAFCILMTSCL